MLSQDEILRYARHLNLPHFGKETQEKLKASKVLVVGTGGLGAPLLQYLTAAGVGTIGVVDFDVVDESNLQRQVLFGTSNIGDSKTKAALQKLQDLNPHVVFIEHPVQLTSQNALEIISQYDVVADGTDNFPTRYLVNDACVICNKTNVYASIFQFEGQVSVFNYQDGPNYRDLYPTPPPPGLVPSCAEGGVLGVLPGIIGSLQALEVIKVLTGIGDNLSGRLFLFDALEFTSRTLKVRKNPETPVIGELIDYEEFCGLKSVDMEVQTITVEELNQWMTSGKDFILVDVREDYEYEVGHLDCQHICLYDLPERWSEIPTDKPIILYCKSGNRSSKAYKVLAKQGIRNHYSLQGGITAWAEAFDEDLVVL